jgi:hypothetical protein
VRVQTPNDSQLRFELPESTGTYSPILVRREFYEAYGWFCAAYRQAAKEVPGDS